MRTSAAKGADQRRHRVERALTRTADPGTLVQGLFPGERDLAEPALVVVDDDALHHVVDLVDPDVEREIHAALDVGLVLEVSDTACREQHPAERELPRGLRRPCDAAQADCGERRADPESSFMFPPNRREREKGARVVRS